MSAHLALALCLAPGLPGGPDAPPEPPLRVFLRGGPKTHGPGQHEHGRFVVEWKDLLASRGASVEGALRFPSAGELARTDVLVMYAADGGSIRGEERTRLESYLAGGGGIVVLHDAICSDDPLWFRDVVGGAWEHGRAKWHEGQVDLSFPDPAHPITSGMEGYRFDDEIYTDLHLSPDARVLVQGFQSIFEISPQAWTFEKAGYRAFVSIQGHEWTSFSHPAFRALVLRGIAWAGRRDADLLLSTAEREVLAYPPGGPLAAGTSAGALVLHPDFELSLVAAEPLVVKPISIEWDPRGRMWVAETPGYPEKERFSGRAARDSIAILEDADGDGRPDRRKVFAGGLDLATSLVLHRDGAIVAQAPEILFLRDTDGDDVADVRETLFTGFGAGDTHAVVSNLRWGQDGWIYATQGYSGGESRHVTNAAGRDFGHVGNGVLRFRPDGSAIEVVSAYGSNTWGLDFSDEGELFFTMANGTHLRHVVVPERALAGGRTDGVESWADCPDHDRVVPLLSHSDPPYAQIDFIGGFTGASGCLLYTGGAWPGEWRNAHFTCEPTVHLVHHDVVEPDGVTFRATKAREAEFLAGTDLWFRPIHLRVGPDGAVYVLDFYNRAIVHNDPRGPAHGPTNAALRPDRDHAHGRIWRVQHRAATRTVLPDLARAGAKTLALCLEHPNGWVRGTAQRLLVERGAREAAEDLRAAAGSERAATRIAALWTLRRLDALDERTARGLLDDPDAAVRACAIRAIAQDGREGLTWRADAIAGRASDASARVRLEALVALGDLDPAEPAVAAIVRLWPGLEDPWTRHASARIAARNPLLLVARILDLRLEDSCLDLAVEAVRRASSAGTERALGWLVILLAMHEPADPAFVAALLDRIRSGSPDAPTPLVLKWIVRDLKRLLARGDLPMAAAALRLAERWGLAGEILEEAEALAGRLEDALDGGGDSEGVRLLALRTLLAMPGRRARALDRAAPLLDASRAPEDLDAAVDAIGGIDDAAAARLLAGSYPSLPGRAQDRVFEHLLARVDSTAALLDEIGAGRLRARELSPGKLHRLRRHPDSATAARATALLEGASEPAPDVGALIARLLPEVDRPGDASLGKGVFAANCAPCHAAAGAGGRVGPDLTGIGVHGARDLLLSILDPGRAVEASYAEWTIETTDGRVLGGVVARETADSLRLRWSGGEEEVPRAEIASMRNTRRSPMPSGFESLGAGALRDLLAFLAAGTEGFRVLDLAPLATSSSLSGLYDAQRDAKPMRFARYGVVPVRGVPFEILDPGRAGSGANAVVLRGGMQPGWDCKERAPRRVEVPVGRSVSRVHVLGGIAAFAFPWVREVKEALNWTWVYEDGASEAVVLRNGVEIADWIRRSEVPGSEYVEGILAEGSWGQVRYHALAPSRPVPLRSIVLESFDNEFAPTIFALTAELRAEGGK